MSTLLAVCSSAVTALFGLVVAFPGRKATGAIAGPHVQMPAVNTARETILARFKAPKTRGDAPIRLPAAIMRPAEHFARVGNVIQTAVRSAEFVKDVQEKARVQLEVAEFSIDRILDEVAEVMTLTPQMRPRLAPVSVAPRAIRTAA